MAEERPGSASEALTREVFDMKCAEGKGEDAARAAVGRRKRTKPRSDGADVIKRMHSLTTRCRLRLAFGERAAASTHRHRCELR